MLQDHILNRRSARKRFADDSILRDQGERYSQDGLDVLQHVTIHIMNDSRDRESEQGRLVLSHEIEVPNLLTLKVLVLFPPYPELEGDNDPIIFLDALSTKENMNSFQEFRLNRERSAITDRETRDVEVFANDLLFANEPKILKRVERVIHLVRSYALNAWFDRLQSLECQLQDLNIDLSHGHARDYDSQDSNKNWIITAILRYILSLEMECHRLIIDLREAEASGSDPSSLIPLNKMMEKYTHITSRMNFLLIQAQHVLEMKTTKVQNNLVNFHIKESSKSVEEAAKAKRYVVRFV